MTLSEEAEQRLADIVELQPTKNAALQERWGLESGSEVHQYLESELSDYYYRNESSLICATPDAELLVGDETERDGPRVFSGTELEAEILTILPGPDAESQSVVATLHAVQEYSDLDPTVDEVRSALHTLSDKGLVNRIRKSVPTFRLALSHDEFELDVSK